MRVRKLINLYESEPSHAEILDYLDSIDGNTRRQQALVQMLIIGFRVMDRQESGEEALFRSRNPDMSALMDGRNGRMIEGIDQVKRISTPKRKSPVKKEKDISKKISKNTGEYESNNLSENNKSDENKIVEISATSVDDLPSQETVSGNNSDPIPTVEVQVKKTDENVEPDALALLRAMAEDD